MKKQIMLITYMATFLSACSPLSSGAPHINVSKLAFTCVHETKPPLSPDTQKLYNYARYHDLHNMWNGKPGDLTWQDAAAYYRIAAANGDYKANVRLQYLLRTGRVNAPNAKKETLKLNDLLMNQLPGTAHYHSYLYLKYGYGLIGADELAYLRKAADLGSKEAQYELSEIFENIKDEKTLDFRFETAEKLLACASEQGMGVASRYLGISLQLKKNIKRREKYCIKGQKTEIPNPHFAYHMALKMG